MKLNQESQNEMRVFKRFAKVCPYSFNYDSIKKHKFPEPGILSKLSDDRVIAFELVDCLGSYLSSSIWNCCETSRIFNDALSRIPDKEKHRIESKFGNLLICIFFSANLDFVERTPLIKPIFDLIWDPKNEEILEKLTKPSGGLSANEFKQFTKILKKEKVTEDELWRREPFSKAVIKDVHLKIPRNLKHFVNYIRIFPGTSHGPYFLAQDAVWLDYPIEKRIIRKIKEKFRTKYRTELLVYYEVERELPAEYWISPEMDSVAEELKKSIFKRIWLFSVTEDKITYVFPGLTKKSKAPFKGVKPR